nr:hypothetical protein [Tanacetum cinerariifolium]
EYRDVPAGIENRCTWNVGRDVRNSSGEVRVYGARVGKKGE